MQAMRRILHDSLRRVGLSAGRWPPNRFDAMDAALRLLQAQGFAPRVVVDVGANIGEWTTLASRIFREAEFHLVEPQPACVEALRRFAPPRYTVHPVALTAGGIDTVRIVGGAADGRGTGAGVVAATAADPPAALLPATTLDALLGGRWSESDRVLLKLDVESHEMTVLAHGLRVLGAAEVVVIEFQAFPFDGVAAPLLGDMLGFLHARGFTLYDFAGLASRPRDQRLRTGDAVFVRTSSPLALDTRWA